MSGAERHAETVPLRFRIFSAVPAACAFVSLVAAIATPSLNPWAMSIDPFPVHSSGDIHFDLDQTTFFREDTGAHAELHLRIPNDELRFEQVEGAYAASLQLEATAIDTTGKATTYSRTIPILVSDATAARALDQVQILTAQLALHPGTYHLRVTVTDRKALKRGILYMIKKKQKVGRAEAALTIPPPPAAGELRTSDLQFAWHVMRKGGESEPHVVPNPSRTYGLYLSFLSAYLEVYDLVDTTGSTYYIDSSVIGGPGDTVASSVDTVRASGSAFGHVLVQDLTSASAGRYTYAVSVHRADGRAVSSTSGSFDVIWQGASWSTADQDQLDVARFLLSEDEFSHFSRLSVGERETYLATFWKKRDPTPDTAFNELRAEFERRVMFANEHYGVLGKGLLSDRGKIYVRYGPPDDLNTHVFPLNQETIRNELKDTGTGQDLLVSGVPRVEETERNRPFEVWTYDQGGRPLFEEQGLNVKRTGVTYVFVDEQGWGDYILRYTTESSKY